MLTLKPDPWLVLIFVFVMGICFMVGSVWVIIDFTKTMLFRKLCSRAPTRSKAYYAYHNSAEWQIVRAKRMLRAQGLCERCHTKTAREIHILAYPSNLWSTTEKDCLALCEGCHKIMDTLRKERNKQ